MISRDVLNKRFFEFGEIAGLFGAIRDGCLASHGTDFEHIQAV